MTTRLFMKHCLYAIFVGIRPCGSPLNARCTEFCLTRITIQSALETLTED